MGRWPCEVSAAGARAERGKGSKGVRGERLEGAAVNCRKEGAMKRILMAVGALVIGATLAWAAGEEAYPRPAKPAKAYPIGVPVAQRTKPPLLGQAYGYVDEAERLGARVILHDAGGYQFLDKQIAQMEDLIASKVDASALVAGSGPGTGPGGDRAVGAG